MRSAPIQSTVLAYSSHLVACLLQLQYSSRNRCLWVEALPSSASRRKASGSFETFTLSGRLPSVQLPRRVVCFAEKADVDDHENRSHLPPPSLLLQMIKCGPLSMNKPAGHALACS